MENIIRDPDAIHPDQPGLLLLGFDRARWERRKKEAREQWEKERRYPTQTVTTRAAIERADAQYWRDKQFSARRKKYMQEAEEARERYGPCDEILKSLLEQLKEDETA